jgi:hypothetical protein
MKIPRTSMFRKPRPKGWGKNKGNGNAKNRKHGIARTTRFERELVEVVPPPVRRGKGDYLAANCVVLAAAVFGPASQAWAEALLPAARQLDARGAR